MMLGQKIIHFTQKLALPFMQALLRPSALHILHATEQKLQCCRRNAATPAQRSQILKRGAEAARALWINYYSAVRIN